MYKPLRNTLAGFGLLSVGWFAGVFSGFLGVEAWSSYDHRRNFPQDHQIVRSIADVAGQEQIITGNDLTRLVAEIDAVNQAVEKNAETRDYKATLTNTARSINRRALEYHPFHQDTVNAMRQELLHEIDRIDEITEKEMFSYRLGHGAIALVVGLMSIIITGNGAYRLCSIFTHKEEDKKAV